MTKTSNYQLNQWEASDSIRREDFNESNRAIDAAIKAVADTASSKASAESVAAVSTALDGKGNCRIAWGSYTGTGTYGSTNPTKLTVDFYPVAVIVGGITTKPSLYWPSILLRPMTAGASDGGRDMTVSWGNNAVQWYAEDASSQNNYSSYIYGYIILGYGA